MHEFIDCAGVSVIFQQLVNATFCPYLFGNLFVNSIALHTTSTDTVFFNF